jgi:outer membrane protein insertion porin family
LRIRVCCAVLLVLLLHGALEATAAASQTQPAAPQVQTLPDLSAWIGRTVTLVRVEIEGQPAAQASLFELLEVRRGVPLADEAVRESLAHLRNLDRYETVAVTAQADREGVVVVFSLTPRHPIDRLEFRGNAGLDGRSLERAVLEQTGGRLVAVRTDVATEAVRRLLADVGFYRPVVAATVEPRHDVHAATLVLTVDAGPRQRIGNITVGGDSPLPAAEVLDALSVSPGAPYRRRAIEDALRAVAERLRTRRYYEASASHFSTGDGEVVDLTITVDAGPIFDIVVTGDPLPDGGVDQWIPIRRENSADEDLLEDSAFRIRTALQREGYWRARVDARRAEEPGGDRMVVTVDVSRGRRYRLRDVTIGGNTFITTPDARALLALQLGEPFRADEVAVRVQALASAYALAGYAVEVDVIPEEVPSARPDQDGEVVVHLTISEGPARTVGDILIVGASQFEESEVRKAIQSRTGEPLRDELVRADRNNVEALYRNAGFQSATVTVALAGGPRYTATFTINEGRQTIVDHVIVTGNSRVSTATILGQVTLRQGQPLGLAARAESQRRLNDLAIFRRVSITQAPDTAGDGRVDVIVHVEESPATTIGYGGGIEFGRTPRTVEGGVEDRFEFAPRGFVEIGRRNLFGGNRSINLFSRISVRPRNDPDDPARDGTGFGVSEYRVTGSYRAARAWRSNTDLVVSATAERAIRTSFTFVRRAANAEALRRLSSKVSIFGRYALDSTRLFDTRISEEDQPLIDRLFPQIRLSSISSGIVWDNRDDFLDPTSGGWLSADAEIAARSLGSQVGFVKAFLQATGFRRITRANRVVLAGRLQVGVARGFERQVTRLDANGVPIPGPDGQPLTDTVADLPAGRRFFTGGSTSVRGFQQDRLGVPAILNPTGLSNGGNGLVVMNGEVRTQLLPSVSLVGFIDGGNVFARVSDIRPGDFRGAAGLGIRYRSPLGPLRLDFGFKFDRLVFSGKRERGWEFHLSIGEAF